MNLHIVPNEAQLRYLYSRGQFHRKNVVLTCPESRDYPRNMVSLPGVFGVPFGRREKLVDRGGNIMFNVLTRPKHLVTSVLRSQGCQRLVGKTSRYLWSRTTKVTLDSPVETSSKSLAHALVKVININNWLSYDMEALRESIHGWWYVVNVDAFPKQYSTDFVAQYYER